MRLKEVQRWADRYPWLRKLPVDSALFQGSAAAQISLPADSWLVRLVDYGYAVAMVDARGTGASFGSITGPFAPEEARDACDVSRWLAKQPWSSGAVGMFGRSYLGTSQYFAAAEDSGIRALFPEMALFDLYAFAYPGGVFRSAFGEVWTEDVTLRDQTDEISPLDCDKNGVLLAQARDQHRANVDTYALFKALPYRDSCDPQTGIQIYLEHSPSSLAAKGVRPGAPAYILAGWNDSFVRDAILWYANSAPPRRLVIGPWAHTGNAGFDLFDEHARWYDVMLRGHTPEGEEPPIYYYRMGAPMGDRWQSTDVWPPRGTKMSAFHLREGRAGTCRSVNDGRLEVTPPMGELPATRYRIDFSTTTGTASRWANTCGAPFAYPDMTANDEKALTFTTTPLDVAVEITGHPILHLWIRATAPDVDIFAYLEEVNEEGRSSYITEGVLRSSHRALHPPPIEYGALPYHRSYKDDIKPLPDEPVELVLDLLPVSRVLSAGSRIRLTIAGADRDNALTPDPGEVWLEVYHDAAHSSQLLLPIADG
jgi:putative CocE/NonD family hydrolase